MAEDLPGRNRKIKVDIALGYPFYYFSDAKKISFSRYYMPGIAELSILYKEKHTLTAGATLFRYIYEPGVNPIRPGQIIDRRMRTLAFNYQYNHSLNQRMQVSVIAGLVYRGGFEIVYQGHIRWFEYRPLIRHYDDYGVNTGVKYTLWMNKRLCLSVQGTYSFFFWRYHPPNDNNIYFKDNGTAIGMWLLSPMVGIRI